MVERLDPVPRDAPNLLPGVDRSRRAASDRSAARGRDLPRTSSGRDHEEERRTAAPAAGGPPFDDGLERELLLLDQVLGRRLRARLLLPGEPGAPGIAILEPGTDRILRALPAASAAGAAARLLRGGILVDHSV